MQTPTIIIVHETIKQSIIKDVATCALLIATIGVGVWIGSSALQWIAALLFIIVLLARAATDRKGSFYSFADARAYLDKLERGVK